MFGKRMWAVRIIDHAGLRAGEAVGGELIDLLVYISKQTEKMSRSVGVHMDDASLVLQAALITASDARTLGRLTKETKVSEQAAREYMALLHRAAEITAAKYGRESVLEIYRKHDAQGG